MTPKPPYLDQLIDRAAAKCGSDYKLAQSLKVSRSTVSQWRYGRKTCPAADQALMAHLAGLDAEAWSARALIAQHEGTEKGRLMAEALKKALLATGAALSIFGASSTNAQEPVTFSTVSVTNDRYDVHSVNQKATFPGSALQVSIKKQLIDSVKLFIYLFVSFWQPERTGRFG